MSFGRNPFVEKAELAEQKAIDAGDEGTRRRAYLDAAHLWDRAAQKEKPGKYRDSYTSKAEQNRALAEGESIADDEHEDSGAKPALRLIK